MLNDSKDNCTFSKTHINVAIRFLANTARYSPPTFFTMESTKYKTGSFSVDGAWSNRELNKFRKQQGLKPTFQNKCNLTGLTGLTALPCHPLCKNLKNKSVENPKKVCARWGKNTQGLDTFRWKCKTKQSKDFSSFLNQSVLLRKKYSNKLLCHCIDSLTTTVSIQKQEYVEKTLLSSVSSVSGKMHLRNIVIISQSQERKNMSTKTGGKKTEQSTSVPGNLFNLQRGFFPLTTLCTLPRWKIHEFYSLTPHPVSFIHTLFQKCYPLKCFSPFSCSKHC